MNVFLGCCGGWVRMDGIALFLGGVMDSIVSGNCPFYLLEGGCIGGRCYCYYYRSREGHILWLFENYIVSYNRYIQSHYDSSTDHNTYNILLLNYSTHPIDNFINNLHIQLNIHTHTYIYILILFSSQNISNPKPHTYIC